MQIQYQLFEISDIPDELSAVLSNSKICKGKLSCQMSNLEQYLLLPDCVPLNFIDSVIMYANYLIRT